MKSDEIIIPIDFIHKAMNGKRKRHNKKGERFVWKFKELDKENKLCKFEIVEKKAFKKQ